MIKRFRQWQIARIMKKHRDNKTLVMGVPWYRPEQWEFLKEVVEDKENFNKIYEESRLESEEKIKRLEAQGIHPVQIEVDVEEMIAWCSSQGLSVNPETRTKFMMDKLKELVNQGIIKP